MIIVGRATGKFKGCPSGVLLPTLERPSIAGDLFPPLAQIQRGVWLSDGA